MKPKFEIGDIVIVNENLYDSPDYKNGKIQDYVGVVGTIIGIDDDLDGKTLYEINHNSSYELFYENELSYYDHYHPSEESYSEITTESFLDVLI